MIAIGSVIFPAIAAAFYVYVGVLIFKAARAIAEEDE